ncbi:MAG: RNA polymerase sigma factor [Methylococcaceae bacterium]
MNIDALYAQHQRELVNHSARITCCRDTAEDITQESFIILFREAKKQPIENPRAFLFRVARNLACDYLKHKKVVENYAQAHSDNDEAPSIEHLLAREERVDLVKTVICELPPRCRDTFMLHKLHQMSYAEIAQHKGISESGVEKHIMKGLRHCRRRLKTSLLKADD